MEQVKEALENPSQAKKKAEIELALKEFGQVLGHARERKRFSKVKLAEITGIDRSSLSELEAGTYTPSLHQIGLLAEALEVNPFVFLSAYYGIPLPEFNLTDQETLDGFIKLALDYLNKTSKPLENPLPPPRFDRRKSNRASIDAAKEEHRERAKPQNEPSQSKIPPEPDDNSD